IKRWLTLKVSQKIKSVEEVCRNYAIGAIQGAIKQYFYWRKKGDDEDRAIEKAVNYALGMITSSGVLKNKKRREEFKYALLAMAGLARGIAAMIDEFYEEY
ncbi:MAG: hypothetical protein DRN49_03150, partial [Thaumarchaeota archaeon]